MLVLQYVGTRRFRIIFHEPLQLHGYQSAAYLCLPIPHSSHQTGAKPDLRRIYRFISRQCDKISLLQAHEMKEVNRFQYFTFRIWPSWLFCLLSARDMFKSCARSQIIYAAHGYSDANETVRRGSRFKLMRLQTNASTRHHVRIPVPFFFLKCS